MTKYHVIVILSIETEIEVLGKFASTRILVILFILMWNWLLTVGLLMSIDVKAYITFIFCCGDQFLCINQKTIILLKSRNSEIMFW